jgi:hypothetical protein
MDIDILSNWENCPLTKYFSNALARMTFIRRCGCDLQWTDENKQITEDAEKTKYVVISGYEMLSLSGLHGNNDKYLIGKKHIKVEDFLSMPHGEWCEIFNNFFSLLYDQRRAIPISEYQFYDKTTYLLLDDYVYPHKDQLFLIDTVAHCLRRNPMQSQMEYTKIEGTPIEVNQ